MNDGNCFLQKWIIENESGIFLHSFSKSVSVWEAGNVTYADWGEEGTVEEEKVVRWLLTAITVGMGATVLKGFRAIVIRF